MELSPCMIRAQSAISIQWKENKAVGLVIPVSEVDYPTSSEGCQFLRVRLKGEDTSILGSCRVESNHIIFTPHWNFTPGSEYEVTLGEDRFTTVTIPEARLNERPSVKIYPDCDTVPANLLKVYLEFSHPMQQENIYRFIKVVKNDIDTVSVFLELQPPLWTIDQTRLTLWLDPGRIKRDLGPNKLFGAPLEHGNHYTLIISSQWKNAEGASLQKQYLKKFFVNGSDRIIPDVSHWKVNEPRPRTMQDVVINFDEPLDYALAKESIDVLYNKRALDGKITVSSCGKQWIFTPAISWTAGTYQIIVTSKLEDLAGNNLIRPFDKDLSEEKATVREAKAEHLLEFQLK